MLWCQYIITPTHIMSRLTISLSDERYQSLKEASVARAKSMRELIDESLEFYGIKTHDQAVELVRRARAHSGLSEAQAQEVANREVRSQRA